MIKTYVSGIPTSGKSIAVWLQLQPGQKIVGEGIGIHLAHMVQGMCSIANVHVVIYAPGWTKSVIEEYLWVFNLGDRVEVRYFGPNISIETKDKQVELAPSSSFSEIKALAITRLFSAVPIPCLALLAVLPAGAYFLVRKLSRKFYSLRQALMGRAAGFLTKFVYRAMGAHIDRSAEIEACIVPIGSFDGCLAVKKKPLTVQIPDIVFAEFPEVFDGPALIQEVERATRIIQNVAQHATRVICPSDYVRFTHHRLLNIPEHVSKVVRHAPIRSDFCLAPLATEWKMDVRATGRKISQIFFEETLFGAQFGGYIPSKLKKIDKRKIVKQRCCFGVLRSPTLSLSRFGHSSHWLGAITAKGLDRFPILYFPTQNRPYKNLYRVLLLLERLKSIHGFDPLLLLTCDLSETPHLIDEISERGLQGNVLCLPRLSAILHAAMYAMSDLTISASLFEGGFPFLFGESLSVGTPCIMADIPVVREVIPDSLAPRMLFDPRSIDSMEECVKRALSQREELISEQMPFFELFAKRTWADVAADYLQACVEGIDEIKKREAREHAEGDIFEKALSKGKKDNGFLSQEFWLKIKRMDDADSIAVAPRVPSNSPQAVERRHICADCCFFAKETASDGICRRMPPRHETSIFPRTGLSGWCGEWKKQHKTRL
jgi:glycosyltransferase involved in cell wall biosynthesis